MPKLLQYIELQNRALPTTLSRTTLDKIAQFTNSLTAFCSGKDVDLRLAQTRGFVMDYGRFLTDGSSDGKTKAYSPSIANECIERLRAVIRKAIRMRLIPNYDPIPDALVELRRDVWHLDVKNEQPSALSVNVSDGVAELTRRITWLFTNRNLADREQDPAKRRRLKDETTEARAAIIILFGLFCYGLDPLQVILLPKPSGMTFSSVFIGRYGRELPISPVAATLVRMHNEGKICSGSSRLFDIVSDKDTPEKVARKAERIASRARKWMRSQRVPLDSFTDIFTEWLSLAAEAGASPDDMDTALRLAAEDRWTEIPTDTLLRLNRPDDQVAEFLRLSWYVLCSYSPALRGSRLRGDIARSGIFGTEEEAFHRLYNPTDSPADGPADSSAISRFVFLKANPIEAMLVDRMHREASLLRTSRTNRFAIVPQKEIETLQVALRDFREDVDLVDRDSWIASHRTEFSKAMRVIIHSGPFKGREATIVDIKKKEGHEPLYLLSFAHDTFTVVATRTALSLDPA